MLFSTKKIVCITFTETELCVSEFEKSGAEPKLISSGSVALRAGTVVRGAIMEGAKFTEALRDALRHAQPSEIKTKEVIITVPEQQVYLTLLRFTETKSPSEILEEAPREALASIPLDYTQIYCDFYSLPTQKGRPSEVIYAACDKKILSEYIRILSELKLKPISFINESDAFLASIENIDYGLKLILIKDKQCSYWIVSDGAFVKKIVPSSLRPLSREMNFEKINTEAKTVLAAYQSEEGCSENPTGILVWREPFQSGQEENEKIADERLKLILPRFPSKTALLQRAYGAVRKFFDKKRFGRGIDLLPARFREQVALLQLNTFLTVLSIALIFAAGGAISVYSFAWSEMYFDFQRAEKEASGVAHNIITPRFEEVKARTKRFNEEINALIQIQSKIIAYDSLWDSVSGALVSPGITPASTEFNSSELTFELLGTAKTRNDLRVLQKKLESLPEVAELVSPLSNLDNTNNISYVLTLKLNPGEIPYLTQDN